MERVKLTAEGLKALVEELTEYLASIIDQEVVRYLESKGGKVR